MTLFAKNVSLHICLLVSENSVGQRSWLGVDFDNIHQAVLPFSAKTKYKIVNLIAVSSSNSCNLADFSTQTKGVCYSHHPTHFGCKSESVSFSWVQHTLSSHSTPNYCINILLSLAICHHLIWHASCLSSRSTLQPSQVTFLQLAEPCRSQ